MKKYIMALDQGTTSCRSILFDHAGQVVSVAQKEFQQIYPHPGWVEHDPMEIWNTQLFVALESLRKVGATAQEIAAIGITNQRETTVVWDKTTGLPVTNAIVWQCRRTAERIDELRDATLPSEALQDSCEMTQKPCEMTQKPCETTQKRVDALRDQEIKKECILCDNRSQIVGREGIKGQSVRLFDYIHQTTGLLPDAYFSASKIEWILDHTEGAREKAAAGALLFGTIDTWLIWNLTKGQVHATDRSNASRTMLYDIEKDQWDPRLLEVFSIPESMLPEVKPSGAEYGMTAPGIFGEAIPICGAVGDQQSALFGQCCFDAGDVKNTYGTGCFLLMHTGTKKTLSENGLLTTVAATTDDTIKYALEGSVFAAGAAIQWLQNGLRLFEDAKETEAMALSVADTDGVYVVPAFTGLGAPHWDPYARGTVVGITRGCTREHLVRATLESIAYQTKDILDVMLKESGAALEGLLVDGGVTKNKFLMQFQADIMGVRVIRPDNAEATAQGAAYLAGLTVGFWKDKEELKSLQGNRAVYEPKIEQEIRNRLLHDWNRALERAKGWANEP